MAAHLVGSDQTQNVNQSVRIYSVLLTPAVGVDATLTIYRGQDISVADPLVIRASGNMTSQVDWQTGIEYSNGFVVVPVNVDSFVIGYE